MMIIILINEEHKKNNKNKARTRNLDDIPRVGFRAKAAGPTGRETRGASTRQDSQDGRRHIGTASATHMCVYVCASFNFV